MRYKAETDTVIVGGMSIELHYVIDTQADLIICKSQYDSKARLIANALNSIEQLVQLQDNFKSIVDQ